MSKENHHSTLRILAQVSLIVFVVLFLAAVPSLNVPGKRWQAFAVAAAFAVLPLGAGTRWQRRAGAAGLLISALMIISDIREGRDYQDYMRRKAHEYKERSPITPTNNALELGVNARYVRYVRHPISLGKEQHLE
jgi:hypothetical protein